MTPKERSAWMADVLADATMTAALRLTAVRLALHLNMKTGQLNPRMELLARGTGQSRRAIVQHVGELEARGWIQRASTRGRHANNYELMMIRGASTGNGGAQLTGNGGSLFDEVIRERPFPVTGNGGAQLTAHLRAHRTGKTEQAKENREESISSNQDGDLFQDDIEPPETRQPTSTKRRSKRAGDGQIAEAFGDFWAAYPRRKDRGKAERAFAAAVRAGTDPGVMIAAARDYAAERAGKDPIYTKHAATWINAKPWLDEPDPVTRSAPYGHRPDRAAGVMAALDIAAGDYTETDDGI